MPTNVQRALLAGPGRFNAACLYGNPKASVSPDDIKRAAARLILFFDDAQARPDGLTVLLALSPAVLEGKLPQNAGPSAITTIGNGRFKVENHDVLVQIGAQSDVHRLYALRVIAELFGPLMDSCEEILGARILNGQEPFGFQDGPVGSGGYPHAVAQALPAEGSWLFYQRFRQDASRFFSEKPTALERGRVLGRAPMGDREIRQSVSATLAASPVPDSHYQLMHTLGATLIRRGFACRRNGEEGLAFIGVTPEFATIPSLLTTMIDGHDQLLGFVEAMDGGLFYCPPNADWLVSGATLAFAPTTVGPLSNANNLLSYDTTSAFYDFLMLLKENGLFDNELEPKRISDLARPRMDALYAALSTDPAKVNAMKAAEVLAFGQAMTVNADYDQYITYG